MRDRVNGNKMAGRDIYQEIDDTLDFWELDW